MRRVPRWIRVLALAVFLSLAAGCGSSDEPPVGDLERRLETDTGVAWVVDRDEAGAPAIVTALTPPPPLTTALPREQAAIAFLQSYADLLGAGAHGDLARELVLVADLADRWAPGAHHLRFAQRIPGSDVRVFGADTFVHLDANGAVRFIAGSRHRAAVLRAIPHYVGLLSRTVDRVTSARLCRCGGSARKPFCDGTHARNGFRS